jgi:hypothetical protein
MLLHAFHLHVFDRDLRVFSYNFVTQRYVLFYQSVTVSIVLATNAGAVATAWSCYYDTSSFSLQCLAVITE